MVKGGKGGKGKGDISDLKARLGLKKREKKLSPKEEAAAAAAAKEAAGPTEEDIEEARRAAEEAAAEFGPAEEEFGFMGADKTPVPVKATGPDLEKVAGAESVAGMSKGKMIPLVGGALLLVGVFFVMGRTCGEADIKNEIKANWIAEAENKLKYFKDKLTQNQQKTVLEYLDDFTAKVQEAKKQIDEVGKTSTSPTDFLKLEPVFTGLMPTLIDYRNQQAFFPVKGLLEGQVHNASLIARAVEFANQTERAHLEISGLISELKEYTALKKTKIETVKPVVMAPGKYKVQLPSWTITAKDAAGKAVACDPAKQNCSEGFECDKDLKECTQTINECKNSTECPTGYKCDSEDTKQCWADIPVAEAKWLANAGNPTMEEIDLAKKQLVPRYCKTAMDGVGGLVEIEVPDTVQRDFGSKMADAYAKMAAATPEKTKVENWKQGVIIRGQEGAVWAKTTDVMRLELAGAFATHEIKMRILIVNRQASVVKKIDEIMTALNFPKLEKDFKEWIKKKKEGGDEE